jgi:hypothetical protein
MIPDNVIVKLKALVGPDHLLTTPEERWGYAYDATDRAAMPEAGVFPLLPKLHLGTKMVAKLSLAVNAFEREKKSTIFSFLEFSPFLCD